MYKYFIIALLLVSKASACDFCGCSPSVMNTDVMSLQPQSSVGTSLQYRNFKHLVSDANIKQTQVLTQNFFVSYAAAKWVDIRLSMPIIWMFNKYRSIDANTPKLNEKKFGAGDLILFANFRVWSKPAFGEKKVGQVFNLGYGMSFPTGSKKSSFNELLQDFNFGTETVGFYFAGTYSLSVRKWGLTNAALVKLNMYNKDQVKYGNTFSYQLGTNYTQYVKKVTIIPMLGLRFDISERNLHYQYVQTKSGEWAMLLNYGLQCTVKGFTCVLGATHPLVQLTSDGNILQKSGANLILRYQIKMKTKMPDMNHTSNP